MSILERKEREKAERRQAILKAAKEVFFKHGFEQASMDMVAAESELAKGTLYLYFKSKEELYVSLAEEGLAAIDEMIDCAMRSAKTIEEKLLAHTEAYYNFSQKHQDYMKIFMAIHAGVINDKVEPERLAQLQNAKWRRFKQAEDLIKEGMAQGIFRKDINPREMVLMVWSAIAGAIMMSSKRCNHTTMFDGIDRKAFVMNIARVFLEYIKVKQVESPKRLSTRAKAKKVASLT
ncbi:MAG: TetR/AcrR family transcriptional regulator [Candidatus Thermochlorobacter sp.]